MAVAAAATTSIAAVAAVANVATAPARQSRAISSFAGLRVTRGGSALAERKSVDGEFAQIAASLKRSSRGGALSSRCDLAGEIFGVIPIICGMTLLGIALGFVLLRVEAWVDETAESE